MSVMTRKSQADVVCCTSRRDYGVLVKVREHSMTKKQKKAKNISLLCSLLCNLGRLCLIVLAKASKPSHWQLKKKKNLF